MSLPVDITNTFPSTLPLPFVNYSGAAGVSTIVSPNSMGRSRRRFRWYSTYTVLEVSWRLTHTEWGLFKTFWEGLGNGTAKFAMELRYPKTTDLDVWVCQFLGDLNVSNVDGHFREVGTTLHISIPTTVNDKAVSQLHFFWVLPVASGAPEEQFFVQTDESAVTTSFIVQ